MQNKPWNQFSFFQDSSQSDYQSINTEKEKYCKYQHIKNNETGDDHVYNIKGIDMVETLGWKFWFKYKSENINFIQI